MMRTKVAVMALFLATAGFTAQIANARSSEGFTQTGIASYYWQPQKMAWGGRFNPNANTLAHRTLPKDTYVRVTNLRNGRVTEGRVTDRGPYVKGRIADLSRKMAQDLSMTKAGITKVKLEVIKPQEPIHWQKTHYIYPLAGMNNESSQE